MHTPVCLQVNKKNTIEYMNGMVDPSFECWAPHSWQLFLFPFGASADALPQAPAP